MRGCSVVMVRSHLSGIGSRRAANPGEAARLVGQSQDAPVIIAKALVLGLAAHIADIDLLNDDGQLEGGEDLVPKDRVDREPGARGIALDGVGARGKACRARSASRRSRARPGRRPARPSNSADSRDRPRDRPGCTCPNRAPPRYARDRRCRGGNCRAGSRCATAPRRARPAADARASRAPAPSRRRRARLPRRPAPSASAGSTPPAGVRDSPRGGRGRRARFRPASPDADRRAHRRAPRRCAG